MKFLKILFYIKNFPEAVFCVKFSIKTVFYIKFLKKVFYVKFSKKGFFYAEFSKSIFLHRIVIKNFFFCVMQSCQDGTTKTGCFFFFSHWSPEFCSRYESPL